MFHSLMNNALKSSQTLIGAYWMTSQRSWTLLSMGSTMRGNSYATCVTSPKGGFFTKESLLSSFFLSLMIENLLPVRNWEYVQQLLFSLEVRLKQQEPYLLDLPFHVLKKRFQQIEQMDKDQKEELDKVKRNSGSSHTPASSGGYKPPGVNYTIPNVRGPKVH